MTEKWHVVLLLFSLTVGCRQCVYGLVSVEYTRARKRERERVAEGVRHYSERVEVYKAQRGYICVSTLPMRDFIHAPLYSCWRSRHPSFDRSYFTFASRHVCYTRVALSLSLFYFSFLFLLRYTSSSSCSHFNRLYYNMSWSFVKMMMMRGFLPALSLLIYTACALQSAHALRASCGLSKGPLLFVCVWILFGEQKKEKKKKNTTNCIHAIIPKGYVCATVSSRATRPSSSFFFFSFASHDYYTLCRVQAIKTSVYYGLALWIMARYF